MTFAFKLYYKINNLRTVSHAPVRDANCTFGKFLLWRKHNFSKGGSFFLRTYLRGTMLGNSVPLSLTVVKTYPLQQFFGEVFADCRDAQFIT